MKNGLLTLCLMCLIWGNISCQKEAGSDEIETGIVTGYVRDVLDNPIKDVTVGIRGLSRTALTDEKGFYAIDNVPVADAKMSFTSSKQDCERSLLATLFIRGTAYVDVVFEAKGMIRGAVINAEGEPFGGVTVGLDNGTESVVTNADGKYLFSDVEIKDYKLLFSAVGCSSVSAKASASMFRNPEVCANVNKVLFKGKLLPELTIDDLKKCNIWYYNEYRGGHGTAETINSACNSYMSLLDLKGSWQNQSEGTTLRAEANSEPEDMDDFQSFIFGRKMITEDNKILTLNVRTHNAESASPVAYGVQVIDIHANEPILEYIGERNLEMVNNTSQYSDVAFDLSPYVGKEIVVAIGIYRNASTVKQFVIRKMSFAPKASKSTDYVANAGSGDIQGLDGWHISAEMVRSIMVNSTKTMTGLPLGLGSNDIKNGDRGFQPWKGKDHFMESWAFQYMGVDPQPEATQGFVIKCRGTAPVNTSVPESYIYSKYAISSGCNKFIFNIGGVFSTDGSVYVKLTVIRENGTYAHIEYTPNGTTSTVMKASDDLLKVSAKGNIAYDLSAYNGESVVVVFGIYQGAPAADKTQHRFALAQINIQ